MIFALAERHSYFTSLTPVRQTSSEVPQKAELIWEAIVSIGSLSLAKLDSLDADYSSSAQRSLCASFWSG
jgi:hypothetical protein